MNEVNQFKVLLYFDGSPHSLSAAVYTANLFKRMPNLFLTIVHVQDYIREGNPKDFNLSWSSDSDLEWKKRLFEKMELSQRKQYSEIIAKVEDAFLQQKGNITQQIIFTNPNIPDMAGVITEFVDKKHIELIIMGTRGPSSLKGVVYGSLAHSVLNKSKVPVLLIKKLPQEFIERFCNDPQGKTNCAKVRRGHLSLAKNM